MTEKILVIGGGIVGVSVATQLLRRGKSVVLADANRPGSPDQASYGNAGILAREGIVPNASPTTLLQFPKLLSGNGPIYVNWKELPFDLGWIWNYVMSGKRSNRENFASAMNALIYDTLDQHLSLAEGTPAKKCIKLGDFSLLYPSRRMRKSASTSHALRSDFGIEFTYRERADLQARDPNLGPRYKYAVDFHDHGWIVNPSAYIDALFESYIAKGGHYINRNVVELGNGEVTFDDGMVGDYDQIVLAAGIGALPLASRLGHNVSMRAERGYHLSLQKPNMTPPNPYLIMDNLFGFTPMDGFIRAAGQTDLSSIDNPPKRKAFRNLEHAVRLVYPDLKFARADRWMGARPTISDGLPMLGRSDHAPKVLFAFGSQHLGLTMGPKMAQIIANIIVDHKSNIDLSPFDPHRFKGHGENATA